MMKMMNKTAFAFGALLCASLMRPFSAFAIETAAKQAFLIDFDTKTVLFEKQADKPMPPASMSKLMTAYVLFDHLQNGSLDLDDEFRVSRNAWKKGGAKTGSSTMFLKEGQRVKVRDLLRGIIVQSGNDACIVAAEGLAGSEEDFVALENAKAKELGLTNTHLVNPTGWPDEKHLMSPRDLATLAERLIRDFPEYYPIYSEKEFTYNKIKQGNRNPLLYLMPEADGLKTGHTSASGYGLVASAKRKDRRLILVVNGLKSMKERSNEAERLMRWGLREFSNYKVLEKGVKVVSVPVWLGVSRRVAAVPDENVVLTLKAGGQKNLKVVVRYDSPLKAPVKKGQVVATAQIVVPDQEPREINLYADRDVAKVGFFERIKQIVKYLLLSRKAL